MYRLRRLPWKAISICTGTTLAATLVICAITVIFPFWLVFPLVYWLLWRLSAPLRAVNRGGYERFHDDL